MINQHSDPEVQAAVDASLEAEKPRIGSLLTLRRGVLRDESEGTIGRLVFRGYDFVCDVLEPPKRAEKPHRIPAGRYEIRITHSPKFGVEMPILCEVPGFSGVRIHPGNLVRDTDGCLLPGHWDPTSATIPHVASSRNTYNVLFALLSKAPGPIFIEISDS